MASRRKRALKNPKSWLVRWRLRGSPKTLSVVELLTVPQEAFYLVHATQMEEVKADAARCSAAGWYRELHWRSVTFRSEDYSLTWDPNQDAWAHSGTARSFCTLDEARVALYGYLKTRGAPAWVGHWAAARARKSMRDFTAKSDTYGNGKARSVLTANYKGRPV